MVDESIEELKVDLQKRLDYFDETINGFNKQIEQAKKRIEFNKRKIKHIQEKVQWYENRKKSAVERTNLIMEKLCRDKKERK